MRIYFIKDWDDTPGGGTLHKRGEDVVMWTTTAERAVRDGAAVPYEQRHLKRFTDESQTEQKTGAQSGRKAKKAEAKGAEKKDND